MHVVPDPAAPVGETIGFDDWLRIDIRVGTVAAAEPFPEARKPALKLRIDFGPALGVKRSSAQVTKHYALEALIGRQIGKFLSEVLTLGFPDAEGQVVLFSPDSRVPDGGRLF